MSDGNSFFNLQHMAKNKTTENKKSVDAFIDQLHSEQAKTDTRELITILTEHTGLEPAMWGSSIIGFGSYHYKYESGREGDMPLVGFSPRKTAISLYLCQSFKEKESLLAKLGKHKASVGCVYIKKLADIDIKVLRKLVDASSKEIQKLYPKQ